MSQNFKRVLSIILLVFTVFAWYVTIFGIGKIEPIKDKLNLGLDIKGGVYVVMEAETDYTGDCNGKPCIRNGIFRSSCNYRGKQKT